MKPEAENQIITHPYVPSETYAFTLVPLPKDFPDIHLPSNSKTPFEYAKTLKKRKTQWKKSK